MSNNNEQVERKSHIKRLFLEALDEPIDARDAFLGRCCGDDAGLRENVVALLDAYENAGEFLAVPTGGFVRDQGDTTTALAVSANDLIGSTIDRYTILELIGEGGFGVVYRARQDQPVRREVALKIIKPGMDSAQVIARFEAERQALAMLDHPNIARILDAGTTDGGRPFFVMDLVKGIPITSYCDQAQLSTPDRIELFTHVCRAVHHAHERGIIHRDLKPRNILVTLRDGRPVPKVIDFGIAKAVEGKLTDVTMLTAFHQFVGTPAYMSPEQTQISETEADRRSDVYSLGAVLYELLTGTPPLDGKVLQHAAIGEIQRIIREVDPPKPSTRLTSMGADLDGVAALRGVEPGGLQKLLRGDLDCITMKSMEKEAARRYACAAELADDLERHLDERPVSAGPPGLAYRSRRFVRRHRIGVAFSLMLVILIGAGLVITATAYVKVHRERAAALSAERLAREQSDRSAAVSEFLSQMLSATDSQAQQEKMITTEEVLGAAARKVAHDKSMDDATRARLQLTIGKSYAELGARGDAIRELSAAYKNLNGTVGQEHGDTITVMELLALQLAEDNQLGRAVEFRERIWNALAARDDVERARRIDAIDRLIETVDLAGDTEGADAWRREKKLLGEDATTD
ncbi:MAG: serine/threonine protein kinase [Planctomycetota bacterium]|jgi:serine/threonine protein kinase